MNDIQKNIIKLSNNLRDFTKREANETKIASKILRKIILNNFKIIKEKVSEEEVQYLKDHSKDILKLVPIIVMFPTPIPYFEIALLLKGIGIDVLPKTSALKTPEEIID